MSVSALQMATAISAIANGGSIRPPSLIDGYVDSDGDGHPGPGAASGTGWSARRPPTTSPG